METLARLSFWMPAERIEDFAAAYDRQLVPLLERHGLEASAPDGRPAVAGVFRRVFAVERPADIAVKARALARDAEWQATLRKVETRLEPAAPRDGVPYRLDVYATPAGPGQARAMGSGFRQGVWQSFGILDGVPSLGVWGMLQDRHGHLWFGGVGVSRYDGTQLIRFTPRDGLPHDWVHALLEDRQGHLWFGTGMVGTWGGGLSRYDGTQFVTFTTRDGLPSNGVTALLEDRHGQLWIGTNSGVARYDGHAFTAFPGEEGVALQGVRCILEDRAGQLWFATFGDGVWCYDGQQLIPFTTRDGLSHDEVVWALEDRAGQLWFATFGGGVTRFDGRVFQHLSHQDGLALDTAHQLLQDRAGAIWIATEGGLTRYRPGGTPPGIRLTQVMADRPYGPVAALELPASQQGLWFEFEGASLRRSGSMPAGQERRRCGRSGMTRVCWGSTPGTRTMPMVLASSTRTPWG
jgi:ligand-binding sensor domain-containing protein